MPTVDLRSISRTVPLLSFLEQFTLCERALGICEGEHDYVRTCGVFVNEGEHKGSSGAPGKRKSHTDVVERVFRSVLPEV
jgi:hypothetical protein